MIVYNQGDVILVKFVFSEGTGYKKRPALVLSADNYHHNRQEVVIAAITSNIQRILVGDTKISHWQKANLLAPSLVAGIVQTIKGEMIERRLGILSKEDFQRVQKNLKVLLGL